MTKPKLWCLETKSRVLDSCRFAQDGSRFFYQDFASVGDNTEQACLYLKEHLRELGLELDELIRCELLDNNEVLRRYRYSRGQKMIGAAREASYFYLDDWHRKHWLVSGWSATEREYQGYIKDHRDQLWLVAFLQSFGHDNPSNFDGTDKLYTKLIVPAPDSESAKVAASEYLRINENESVLEWLSCQEFHIEGNASHHNHYVMLKSLRSTAKQASEYDQIQSAGSVSIEILDSDHKVSSWVELHLTD